MFDGTPGTNGSTASVILGDGATISFTWSDASSSWKADYSADSLVPGVGGLLYKRQSDDSAFQFDDEGKLLTITQRNGWKTTYTYSTASTPTTIAQKPNRLISVSNQFGKTINFIYDTDTLYQVVMPDGQLFTYLTEYGGWLRDVISPGSLSGTVKRTYRRENGSFPFYITNIIDEANTRLTTYGYDAQGRGISTEHAGGVNLYVVNYGTAEGSPTVVIDPLGTARSYNYATQYGKLAVTGSDKPSGTGESDAAARVQNASGLIDSETDFLGVQTMYTWDINRRLPLSTTRAANKPEAQTTSTQWHPIFRLPVLVTEAGRSTAYTYDTDGNKLTESVTDTATNQVRTWAWTYIASGTGKGLVASMTDPKGGVWNYSYDGQGNRTSVTNPLGQVTQYSYDTAGRLSTETAPNGLVTTYGYDLRSRVISASIGSGSQAELTSYSYNAIGKLAGMVLPSGYSASYSYDAAQRLIGALDNRGNSVAYTLDAMGNRTREEIRDAASTLALATGRVVNSLNRVQAIQGAAGQSTILGYDANGEAVSQADPLNQTTVQTLDSLRRPTVTTLPDNATAAQSWNALDQLTQVTDPKGIATQYQRNAFGEVMSEASPDAGTTSYQRNLAGEVIGQVDAKGNTTSISRDALGRPLTVTRTAPGSSSTANVTSYTWDSGGLLSTGAQVGYLVKVEDKSGSATYERDAFGRVLSKTQRVNDNPSSPSSFKTSYTYSTGINKGLLASIVYPSGLTVYYNRNASGQITGMSTKVPGNNKPVVAFISNLSYTALGAPKAWSWSNGDAAARSFDADGRMSSNEFASYSFDAASRITGINQTLWASRTLTQVITSSTGTSTTVTTELYQTPLSWTASYDSRDRLTGFNRAGAQSSYSYDANSNRLTSVDKVTSDTDLDGTYESSDISVSKAMGLQVDATSNKLLGFTLIQTRTRGTRTLATTSSAVNYNLDASGSLVFDGLRGFDYDEANRLAKIRLSSGGEAAAIAYLHNAWGQRVFKGEPTPETLAANQTDLGVDFVAWLKSNFSWLYEDARANTSVGTAYTYGDGPLPEWALLGEYDNGSAAGKGRSEYLWLPAEDGNTIPVGMFRNNRFFAIHSDHLGSPRLMTNDLNTPVWQWPYSAFGETKPTGVLKSTPNPNVAITNQPVLLRATAATEMNLRFPGQYADAEAGNFYNYLRDYDAATGRYRQSDPIGLGGGLNRFGYVGGNALGFTDPMGLNAGVGLRLGAAGGFAIGGPPGAVVGGLLGAGAGLLLGYGLDRMFNNEAPPRGLPPEGVKPPIPEADECKPGPASRPSERDKGGKSLWDPDGGEWRWFPGDKWHNPHWDYNSHDGKSSPWINVPHGGLPPVKK